MTVYDVTHKHEENGAITKILTIARGATISKSISKSDAISLIESKDHTLFTKPPSVSSALILVVQGQTGKYLRTNRDDTEKDNLDELPDF